MATSVNAILALVFIGFLFGCGKTDANNQTASPSDAPQGQIEINSQKEPPENKDITVDKIIGKKITRSAPGPDDTANFNIIILENGALSGDQEGSISGATGILYYDAGRWSAENNQINFQLEFTGQVTESTGEAERQVEKSQTIKFTVPLEELANSKDEYYDLGLRPLTY